MKIHFGKWLAVVGILLAVAASAQTHVKFDLAAPYFNANPASNRVVTLQPLTPFPGNLITYTSSAAGIFYHSNSYVGDFAGTVKAKGQAAQIPFQITVTATNLGIINADTITSVLGQQSYPSAGKSSWSIQSTDQRFVLNPTNAANASDGQVLAKYGDKTRYIDNGSGGVFVQTNISYVAVTNAPWANTNQPTLYDAVLSGSITLPELANIPVDGSLPSGFIQVRADRTIQRTFNGELLTNVQMANVEGLTNSLAYLSNNVSGGSATNAAGSNTWVQFNDGGSFGADSGMAYDKTNDSLTVAGGLQTSAGSAGATAAGRFYANGGSGSSENFIAGAASLTVGTSSDRNALVGGAGNTIGSNSDDSAVVGGTWNQVGTGINDRGQYSGIFSGYRNTLAATTGTAQYSGIFSGQSNLVTASYATAGGLSAQAVNQGTWVWADSSTASPFASTSNNQFLVRASGGVGINTNNPGNFALAVHGDVYINGILTAGGTNVAADNISASGTVSAASFEGDGSALTGIGGGTNLFFSASQTNNTIPWWPAVWWGDSLTASAVSARIQWSEMTGRTNNNQGITGETSLQIRNRAFGATNDYTTNLTSIIWMGRNDFSQNTQNATNQVYTNIAAIASRQNDGRFFVIQNLNGYQCPTCPTGPETIGTTNYTDHTNLWAMLSATYSNRFIRVRDFLLEWGFASSALQDRTDATNGIIPTSLTISDGVHPTEAAYGLMAHYIMTNINWVEGQRQEPPATLHDIMTAFRTPPALGPVTITTTSSNGAVVQSFDTNGYPRFEIRASGTAVARNLFIGADSGSNVTSGLRSIGIGQYAAQKLTSGSDVVAIGYQAARESTNANDIVAIGVGAARANYGGSTITAVGKNAAEFGTTSSANSLFGYNAGRLNLTGTGLAGFGQESLYNNLSSYNSGFGYRSLYSTTSGQGNTGAGHSSLYGNISGQYNIGLGFSPGYNSGATAENSTNDTYSIYIGYLAGRDASIAGTAVANSIALGKNAKVTASNQLKIGGTGAEAINVITEGTNTAAQFVGGGIGLTAIPTNAMDATAYAAFIGGGSSGYYGWETNTEAANSFTSNTNSITALALRSGSLYGPAGELLLSGGTASLTLTTAGSVTNPHPQGYRGFGGLLEIDANEFGNNLPLTVDTVQELADAVDDLTLPASGITLTGPGLVGRETSGAGAAALLSVGAGLEITGGALTLTGTGGEATNIQHVIGSASVAVETNGYGRTVLLTTATTNAWTLAATTAAQNATNAAALAINLELTSRTNQAAMSNVLRTSFADISVTNGGGGTTYTNSTGLPGVVVGAGIGTNLATLPKLAGNNAFTSGTNIFTWVHLNSATLGQYQWRTNSDVLELVDINGGLPIYSFDPAVEVHRFANPVSVYSLYGLVPSGAVTNADGSRMAYLTDVGAGGTATNAVSRVLIGATEVGAGVTNLSFWPGTNISITGTNPSGQADIAIRLTPSIAVTGFTNVGPSRFLDDAFFLNVIGVNTNWSVDEGGGAQFDDRLYVGGIVYLTNLTPSRVVTTDANKKLVSSATTGPILGTGAVAAGTDIAGVFTGSGDYLKSDGSKGTPAGSLTIQSNSVQLATGTTTLNYINGANTVVTGAVSGATATVAYSLVDPVPNLNATTINAGTVVGNGSGITNVPLYGVNGLTNSLAYLSNNVGSTLTVQSNGVQLATGTTTINYVNGVNTTVTGHVAGATATIAFNAPASTSPTYANAVPIIRNTNSTDAAVMYPGDTPAIEVDSAGAVRLKNQSGAVRATFDGSSANFQLTGEFRARETSGHANSGVTVNSGGTSLTSPDNSRILTVDDNGANISDADLVNGDIFYNAGSGKIKTLAGLAGNKLLIATNVINTGVIPVGTTTYTNITADITIAGFSGVNPTNDCWANIYVTNSAGTGYPKVTFANSVFPSTNSFVLNRSVYVTNAVEITVKIRAWGTNMAAVRWTP